MIILHMSEYKGELFVWGESSRDEEATKTKRRRRKADNDDGDDGYYPYGSTPDELVEVLKSLEIQSTPSKIKNHIASVTVWLPSIGDKPIPSSRIIAESPYSTDDGDGDNLTEEVAVTCRPWQVYSLMIPLDISISIMRAADNNRTLGRGIVVGTDLTYWSTVLHIANSMIMRQQMLPDVRRHGYDDHHMQNMDDHNGKEEVEYDAVWSPVFSGEDVEKIITLSANMPSSARAMAPYDSNTPPEEHPASLVKRVITTLADYLMRSAIRKSDKKYTYKRTKFDSPHDAWLYALAANDRKVSGRPDQITELVNQIYKWQRPVTMLSRFPFRLCFRLEEPLNEADYENYSEIKESRINPDKWWVRYLLQANDDPSLLIPVEEAWKGNSGVLKVSMQNIKEFLLLSLGQASRICPDIADRLGISKMDGHTLDSNGAYNFLTQEAAALKQTGYGVMLPAWWSDRKRNKLLAKPHASTTSKWGGGSIRNSLFNFDWSVALGDQNVTVEELNELAEQKQSLIQVRGEWMEVNADEIRAAIVFMNKYQKKMNLSDMYRMTTEVPDIIEMGRIEADGWLGDMLERLESKNVLEELEQPANFSGTLRPYQIRGYSWLAFLRQYGLGGCLADDMGLGKTIQMLASIQKDWNEGVKRPILLICPMSVMGNWQREAKKFTPELPVMIHHGTARNKGKEFEESVQNNAIIISSYGLLLRDVEMLREVQWGGIVLDEAQNIKNAATKQSRAARTLSSDYRFALTGTPVENNVGDLWSIMEFLNSGILGSQAEFERNFLAPIHARADTDASDKLKRITEPFILRRLKTDKSIISDLPDKIENKVYCTLTKEQASLYVSIQKEAERVMAEEEGIKRKGVILATMSKLKQVCNHPAQLLKDNSKIADRSGKLARLTEMIEEIVQVGDRALIFTQFVEMGTIIKQHLQETLGIEILFLHGSISQKKRDVMVQQFQSTDDDGDVDNPRIFIVSLKAGGTGLNLTAANHVFHFDRWWNPAVENQATDRAFRIGQKQNVQVHKFICAGTMEEAIDDTIEKKKNVAEQVVGTGEGWLTELSNNELREILKLDRTAAYSGSSRKAEDDDSSSDKSTVDTAAGGRKRGRPRKNAKAGGSP